MQFFYIDYMNGDRKERNVGFLRVERSGVCVGLRGVPAQCGTRCSVYAVGDDGERWRMGEVALKDGYGMGKLNWGESGGFEKCVRVEVPFYKNRKGVCVLRDSVSHGNAFQEHVSREQVIREESYQDSSSLAIPRKMTYVSETELASKPKLDPESAEEKKNADLPDKLPLDKWEQLVDTYPQVHIFPEAQSLLIKPKDLVILTQRYHSLISNSFVLHSYYNYRQLLLFRFEKKPLPENELQAADLESTEAVYYLGVPGVYYDREKRIAQMFGFEGFDIGEARMCEESKREIYEGCFGYYMKQVEI